jgi:hypothetical protein
LLPVHCRKPVPGMKFSVHDLFGSSAYVRGAEVVLGLRRVSDGYAKLHFLKDRDGDLPISTAWGLLFDQEEGFGATRATASCASCGRNCSTFSPMANGGHRTNSVSRKLRVAWVPTETR